MSANLLHSFRRRLRALLALLTAFALLPNAGAGADDDNAEAESATETAGLYRHVVLFQFKDGTADDKVAEIEQAFVGLKDQIDTIIDFEWGTNVSPEGLDDGLTHCFLVTFADAEGLEVYLPHPAHKEFVELLMPHLEKAVVVDYVSR